MTTTPEELIRHAADAATAATPSASETVNEGLPPIVCAPWCREGDGHAAAWHQDDQWCCSEGAVTQLTRMPLRHYELEAWLDNLLVHLAREYEGSAYVCLSHDGDPAIKLSLDEAEKFARDILAEVALARGDGDAHA